MATCGVCKVTIDRSNENKIKCNDCSQIFHSDCLNINKTDLLFMRDNKQIWDCHNCVLKRRNKQDEPINSPKQKTGSVLKIQSQPPANILNEIATLRQDFLKQFSSLKERFNSLEDNLFKKMEQLAKDNDDLKKENRQLQIRLSNAEQHHYSNSIDIIGLPLISDNELLPSVTRMLNVCLNLDIAENEIGSIYKIKSSASSNKPRDIIHVKFVRKYVKDVIMKAKRGKKDLSTALLGSSPGNLIFINHSLCAAKRKIFTEAWKLKKNKKCHHVWYSNGRICMKMDEHGDVHSIDTISDLDFVL